MYTGRESYLTTKWSFQPHYSILASFSTDLANVEEEGVEWVQKSEWIEILPRNQARFECNFSHSTSNLVSKGRRWVRTNSTTSEKNTLFVYFVQQEARKRNESWQYWLDVQAESKVQCGGGAEEINRDVVNGLELNHPAELDHKISCGMDWAV